MAILDSKEGFLTYRIEIQTPLFKNWHIVFCAVKERRLGSLLRMVEGLYGQALVNIRALPNCGTQYACQ